ncbi:MAG: tetratricopeptide repeat protein, partial [Deltaproteobacteria bacterium]
ILAALTFLTWQQCGYWKNNFSLFNHAIKVTENNYLMHNNLGFALAAQGKNEEAIAHYRAAIKMEPLYYEKSYFNLGSVLAAQGKNEEAINYFQRALLINPNVAEVHNRLGNILDTYFKKYDEAIYHYRRALAIEPENPGIHFNLGYTICIMYFSTFGKKGDFKEGTAHFRQAINLKPDYEEARRALKMALEMEQELARKYGGKQRVK